MVNGWITQPNKKYSVDNTFKLVSAYQTTVTTKKDGVTMKRINKREARKLYKQGIEIAMTPHKMRVDNPWGTTFYKELDIVNPQDFDVIVNNMEYYNCNYETGYYLAYYIEQ